MSDVWDRRCATLRHIVSGKLHAAKASWSADEFADALDGLDDEMVDVGAFSRAVNHGRRAANAHRDDADPVIDVWINHVRKYATDVPDRIADELAGTLTVEDDGEATVQDVLDAFDRKLESLRSSITRYADPPWGAGHQGYGAQLESRNILMIWVLDDGAAHCDDCPALADGGPYEHLPTYPGYGDTQCLDKCKCAVQADPESWDASLSS